MNKVQFIDQGGNSFFECHPAEARAAIEFVEDERQMGYELKHKLKTTTKMEKLLEKKEPDIEVEVKKGIVSVDVLADMFAKLEELGSRVVGMIICPSSYADIRKWHREALDIETREKFLKQAIFAYVWGAVVTISKKVTPYCSFCLMDEDGHFLRCKVLAREKSDDTDEMLGKIAIAAALLEDVQKLFRN